MCTKLLNFILKVIFKKIELRDHRIIKNKFKILTRRKNKKQNIKIEEALRMSQKRFENN